MRLTLNFQIPNQEGKFHPMRVEITKNKNDDTFRFELVSGAGPSRQVEGYLDEAVDDVSSALHAI